MSVLAFLGGMGGGYLKQKEVNRQNEREDMRDAMQAEQFGWARDKNLQEKAQLTQNEALEAELQKAMSIGTVASEYAVEHKDADGKSVSVAQPSAGDAEFTAFMQNAAKPEGAADYPESKVAQSYSYTGKDGNKKLFNGANAAQDAAEYAKTNAVSDVDRLNAASARLQTMKGGLKQAIELRNQAAAIESAQLEKDKRFKEAQNENVFEALQYAEIGDSKKMYEAFNKSGVMSFTEPPKLIPVKRTIKGLGDINTFDIVGNIKDKDGNVTPFKSNSFDLGFARLQFKDRLSTQAALNAAGDKSAYQADLAAARLQAAQATAERAAAYSARASGAGDGGGQSAATLGYSDITAFNKDFAALLPRPDGMAKQEDIAALEENNLHLINAGEGLLRTNARFGKALTPNVALAAIKVSSAKDAKFGTEKDPTTGKLYSTVSVGGQSVVVGPAEK